jgi:hypothetical protein
MPGATATGGLVSAAEGAGVTTTNTTGEPVESGASAALTDLMADRPRVVFQTEQHTLALSAFDLLFVSSAVILLSDLIVTAAEVFG